MAAGVPRKASILLVAVLGTALAGWLALRTLRPADRRSVLIVTVDTLRADHLACYGYGRATSPHIDALAREGVLFEQVTTPRPKTGPSMVSLLTGLYPHEHGVRTNFEALPAVRCLYGTRGAVRPDPTTPGLLAERLGVAGFATGACVANFVLTKELSGLDRGFDTYDDELPSSELNRPEMRERKADDTTRAAVGWLRERSDERFFLWVHYIDPHGAYAPPAAFDRFRTPDGGASDARVPLAAMREELPLDQDGRRVFVAPHNMLTDPGTGRVDNRLASYVDRYDGEIAFVDDAIGALIGELRALGRLDDTLIVLTADHGEALGEHSLYFEHGYYVYEPDVRVPLVVRVPPGERFAEAAPERSLAATAAGRRVAAPVDVLDVLPTVLEWLEIEPDMPLSGRSLVPILAGGDGDAGRVTFSERVEFGFELFAARSAGWKLIENRAHPAQWPMPWKRELYDLRNDPGETDNLIGKDTAGARDAERDLGARLQAWLAPSASGGSRADEQRAALERLSDDDRAQLAAMGYAGDADDAPAPSANNGEPDQGPGSEPLAVLRHALATGDARLRALALEGLARAGALDDLAAYLAPDEALAVRVRAGELIGELGRADLAEALAEAAAAARADEHVLRMAATYALLRLGASTGVEELARSTRHWNAGLRALAAWYLGQVRSASVQDALEPLCSDPSGAVRVFAWQALARAGRAGVAAELAREARGGDPETVAAAVRVLGEIGAPLETRELVADLRRAAHPAVVEAGEVLAWWTSPGEAQRAWSQRRSLSVDARRAIVHALGSTLGSAARGALTEALADADAEVRVLAASHLARM